jgi:photosystem II stability/assembly factor-like uncharacterized protein
MKFHLCALVFCIAFLATGCDDDDDGVKQPEIQWKPLGLAGKTVNQMQLHDEEDLYVATTSGLFKGSINSGGGFDPIGFGDKNVQAIEVIGDQHIIASLFDKTGGETPTLYVTENDGDSWELVDTDFGGTSPEPVLDFAIRADDPDTWYATGFGVVAKSENQGATWEPIYGTWGALATGISVVSVHPEAPNAVWAGGQGSIENGFLLRSENETDWDVWDDLVANPTVVKEITFGETADDVYVGFEGALLRTDDGGENWETIIDSDEGKFFFGICLSDGDPSQFYVGGWLKTPDPQSLKLHITYDGGETFEEVTYDTESYGGIWEMVIKSSSTSSKDRLFLGLDKGGVYEVIIPAKSLASGGN